MAPLRSGPGPLERNPEAPRGGSPLAAGPLLAQTPAPAPAKQEEEPFWAMGRPKSGPGAQMAPVPASPIPPAADKLPLGKMKVPPGFKVEVYASSVFDARGLRRGDKGTVFVSGREQMPRLANQREDYLLKAMREYKNGGRLGYGGAMAQELAGLGDEDLADLAHFLARLGASP